MERLIRLATFSALLSACVFHSKTEADKLDNIYEVSDVVSSSSLTCDGVEGRVPDCSECYACDHPTVNQHRLNHEIRELRLYNANCTSHEMICCVSQRLLRFREKTNANVRCGKYNPEGYPRALRPKIRSVLQGEYPWRAWIYHYQNFYEPLCAATYIDADGRTLMTAASCVDGHNARSLKVLFDKDPNNFFPINVKRINVHENYDKDKHLNGIAVLKVEAVPNWAHRACLPVPEPVLHGTACIAVSTDNYFVNQVIPIQKNCVEDKKPLHSSLMCAAEIKGDYTPELGGGMFCMAEQFNTNVYTVYGVYLYSARSGLAAMNVNVTHFAEWLADKIQEHRLL